MAKQKVVFGMLNIAATPHPDGIYERLLALASKVTVRFWGDDWATITCPEPSERGLYIGRVLIGTRLNTKDKLVDFERKDEADDALKGQVNVPKQVGINGKIFHYAFNIKDHVLYFEVRNEEGQNLSPLRCKRIFERLLSDEVLGPDEPIVSVSVVPQDDTLDRIFSLKKISRLEIVIKRPNPDVSGEKARRIIEQMEAENLREYSSDRKAVPKSEGIQPTAETQEEAELAMENGLVRATGKEDGETVKRSTEEYPKTKVVILDDYLSSVSSLISYARGNSKEK